MALYADDRKLVVAALWSPDVASQRQALEDVDPDYVAVPNEFLRYIAAPTTDQPPGPGRALLLVPNLDEYIYAGETTRANGNPELIALLPRVSRLRRMLNKSIGHDGSVDEAKDLIQELSELISKVPFAVPGFFGALAAGNLQSVFDALQSLPAKRIVNDAWRSEQRDQLHAAKSTLLCAREPAPVVPPSPASAAGRYRENSVR